MFLASVASTISVPMRIIALSIALTNGFVVNEATAPLCAFTTPTNPTVGTSIPICVFLMAAAEVKSIAFSVPMDQYAMLTLPGSFGFSRPTGGSDNLYAWATGSPTNSAWPMECALPEGVEPSFSNIDTNITSYSCPQLYMTVDRVVPMASLVAEVENGVLKNLVWDNQCNTCSGDTCIGGRLALALSDNSTLAENSLSGLSDQKVCAVPFEQCRTTDDTAEGINCDFRVLLTWSGTDAEGKKLTSSSMRMSAFEGQSVQSMWDSVANSFDLK